MLGVGDDRRAVGEGHLEARTPVHDLGRGDDRVGRPCASRRLVTDRDLAHRRPAGRRRERRVERQRLAEPRPAGDDDELAGVQAVGEAVEVDEAGGDAGHRAAAAADGLELVHRRLHELLEQRVVLGRAALGDVVDRLLRAVDGVVDAAGAGRAVAELHDAGAGLDEAAQDRLLGDDAGVEAGVGRRRDARQQRVQVRRAADASDLAEAGQLGRHRDRVGGLALAVEVDDDVEDRLVGGLVEVGRADDLDDVGDRVLRQQHAAEHGLLGGDVLRRRALELRRGGAGSLRRQLDDPLGHPDPPLRLVGIALRSGRRPRRCAGASSCVHLGDACCRATCLPAGTDIPESPPARRGPAPVDGGVREVGTGRHVPVDDRGARCGGTGTGVRTAAHHLPTPVCTACGRRKSGPIGPGRPGRPPPVPATPRATGRAATSCTASGRRGRNAGRSGPGRRDVLQHTGPRWPQRRTQRLRAGPASGLAEQPSTTAVQPSRERHRPGTSEEAPGRWDVRGRARRRRPRGSRSPRPRGGPSP